MAVRMAVRWASGYRPVRHLRFASEAAPAPPGLSRDETYLFDLTGFLVVRALLTPEEVRDANAAVDRRRGDFVERPSALRNAKAAAFAGEQPTIGRLETGRHLHWPGLDSRVFRRLLAHPALVPKLHDLVGPGYRLDHLPLLLLSRAGAEGFDLHGGAIAHDGTWNVDLAYTHRDGRMRTALLALSVALTDVAEGSGGFCIIPGSHKANFSCPPSIQALKRHGHVLHQPALRAGDAVLFSEATTHGALPWSPAPGQAPERRFALYRFAPATHAYGRGYLDAWSPELLASLTPSERAVLEPPYSPRLDRPVLAATPDAADAAPAPPAPRDPAKVHLDRRIFGAPFF